MTQNIDALTLTLRTGMLATFIIAGTLLAALGERDMAIILFGGALGATPGTVHQVVAAVKDPPKNGN